MSADVLPDAARPACIRARVVVALALTMAVLAGVAAPIWRFLKTSVYDDPSGYVLAHAVAAVALAGLAVLPHTTPHLGAVLAATALPGGAALYLFGVLTFVDATSGIHTFTDSWALVGQTFTLTAPVFTPAVGSLAGILARKRTAGTRALAALGVTAGAFALSLPGYLTL